MGSGGWVDQYLPSFSWEGSLLEVILLFLTLLGLDLLR